MNFNICKKCGKPLSIVGSQYTELYCFNCRKMRSDQTTIYNFQEKDC